MNQTHKAYTFACRPSLDTNQSLQKSMLSPPLRKNKKSSPLNKNKTLPTHIPTNSKRIIEIVEKQDGMSHDKKEGQLVTCGIFYCRDSAEIKGSGSLQHFAYLDRESPALPYWPYRCPLSETLRTNTDENKQRKISDICQTLKLRKGQFSIRIT